ncbi:hypothetical protein PR048_023110 [Dryococelus australis]|uniref:Uncharacterized protein n=1 Tax=Dryococelus australis TaxID=614101 RepID=A0ABQ9GT60_9NEOP|nr:hypothetical protein PR048_023110 [Dryococelus australis]
MDVSIGQHRNERVGETGDPREKTPPTNGIVRHDPRMQKSGVTQPGIEPESPWLEASRLTAQSPCLLANQGHSVLGSPNSDWLSQVVGVQSAHKSFREKQVALGIGLQFIRHALDASEPIENTCKETSSEYHTARCKRTVSVSGGPKDDAKRIIGTNATDIAVVGNIGSSFQPCLWWRYMCAILKGLKAAISALAHRGTSAKAITYNIVVPSEDAQKAVEEASRACLMNCNPTAKVTSLYTCLTSILSRNEFARFSYPCLYICFKSPLTTVARAHGKRHSIPLRSRRERTRTTCSGDGYPTCAGGECPGLHGNAHDQYVPGGSPRRSGRGRRPLKTRVAVHRSPLSGRGVMEVGRAASQGRDTAKNEPAHIFFCFVIEGKR